jgi:hypothetical protein
MKYLETYETPLPPTVQRCGVTFPRKAPSLI